MIVIHPQDGFERTPYLLRECAAVWRDEGLRVDVVSGGNGNGDTAEPAEHDLAILHVDLTVVPPAHLALAARYPRVINGRVADISKRRVSANVVRRGDGYAGPVIVKTNRNCGGLREAGIADRGTSRLRRRARRALARLSWRWRSHVPSGEYPIFAEAARVPRGVWGNPNLVVERFLPERRDEWYCLRTWLFLGDRETNSLSYAREPVVKSRNIVRREAVAEVPEALRGLRRELGFDFGKFDYAIVDGRVVLYDANRTPTLGAFSRDEFLPRIRLLAEGIRAFL